MPTWHEGGRLSRATIDAMSWSDRPTRDLTHRTMSISLTPAAADRVQSFLTRRGHGVGLRLSVKKTGCSGFGYTVDLAEAIAENDAVFDLDGVRVVVDARSLPFVDGTEIGFERQGLNATFVFHNPNATGECGCGESFTVDAVG